MLKIILNTLALVLITGQALASPTPAPRFIKQLVPGAQLVGHSRLTYMTFPVYDVGLYAPGGSFDPQRPLALKITYLRNLTGNQIAGRSIEEMRQQGFKNEVTLAAWHDKMLDIFPNVKNGTELTGILNKFGTTIFYKDKKEIGRIADPDFGRQFFSIWLGPKTSQPEMRKDLLNLKG